MTSLILLILLIVLIILSGFLSGSETAITATSKARIIYKIKKGNKRAKYVLKILNQKDNVISSLLLSNNLVNILASSLATAVLYDLFGVSGIFYATYSLPGPARPFVTWNPLLHSVELLRHSINTAYPLPGISLQYLAICAFVSVGFGLVFYFSNEALLLSDD